jgi:DNA processing protein
MLPAFQDDTPFWLGFSLVPSIGPRRFAHLLRAFGSAYAAWSASDADLKAIGLEDGPRTRLLQARDHLKLDAEMARVQRAGASLLPLSDPAYPALLRTLQDAPILLYVRGTLESADEHALAIVGTRRATSYGRDAARMLARDLARNQVTVVSGLAQGIDASAHRGALEGGGRTIAVLGSGVDQIYPREHTGLAREICASGAIVSEYPVGTRPDAYNFPRRNRIISGLSLGVLIVEAPEKSGSIITANAAAEQGRDVFAVPANIFNAAGVGSNKLIQDGAKLVQNVKDILDEIHVTQQEQSTRQTAKRIAPDTAEEAKLLALLGPEPIHVDELTRQSGMPVSVVTSTLTMLELKGLARLVGPMQYCQDL